MPNPSRISSEDGDLHILPITLPSLPSCPQATHYLYIRADRPDPTSAPSPRALFIVNVPVDATDVLLKHMLGPQLGLSAGRIAQVVFEEIGRRGVVKGRSNTTTTRGSKEPSHTTTLQKGERKRKRASEDEQHSSHDLEAGFPSTWDRAILHSGSSATVTFVDRESMSACFEAVQDAARSDAKIVWGKGLRHALPELGWQRYWNHYNLRYPPRQSLLDGANAYITAYSEREEALARAAARKRNEPDEDGFVTVSRGGRVGAAKKEIAEATLERQKSKHKGLDDFYRFQFRERMKQRAGDLVKEFEADKEKIRKMRELKGKFRPE